MAKPINARDLLWTGHSTLKRPKLKSTDLLIEILKKIYTEDQGFDRRKNMKAKVLASTIKAIQQSCARTAELCGLPKKKSQK